MKTIAGLVPFTTIDYPGKLAGVVFFQGCPLKCPFCHNPNLQSIHADNLQSWTDDILPFFKTRRRQLDAVVLSGGEPLLQSNLSAMIDDLKALDFSVGLHTSGANAQKLESVIHKINWVGLDIKAPREKYDILTGRTHIFAQVEKSLQLLTASGIDFETRTTLDPRHLTIDDIYKIAAFLSENHVKKYVLQQYRTFETDKNPPSLSDTLSFFKNTPLISHLTATFPNFQMRCDI